MILLAGARISTEEALAWGLFDRAVPRDDLMACAHGLVADSLAADPDHAAALKAMCRAGGAVASA